MKKEKSEYLISSNPDIAAEFHFEKNKSLSVEMLTKYSGKKVWWICAEGHEWQETVRNRTSGCGCPYCSGHRPIPGKSDFATLYPEAASEWNYERNKPLLPTQVTSGSSKKVWWKCSKGHEWETSMLSRKNGRGCPYCANKKLLKGYNDLASVKPELAKEWHPTKNGLFTPDEVLFGSHEKVWWLCPKGHEWEASINGRAYGAGCPYCAKQKPIIGENDLETTNPELAKEWHPVKNGNLLPSQVMVGSDRKVWWLCPKGHEWLAVVGSRRKNGCPICSESRRTSFPEQAVYHYVKKAFPEAENRYKGNGYELDIYIPSIRVGIEYDGVYFHKNKLEKENKKDFLCSKDGITLVRIREDGLEKTNSAINIIRYLGSNSTLNNAIEELFRALHFNINKGDIDVNRDLESIYGQIYQSEIEESLLIANPTLAKEWHPTKNGYLSPKSVMANSNKRVWWQCDKGHEWQAQVVSRNSTKTGCPYCANKKVLQGFNDFKTTNPTLAKEWHPTKNAPLLPTQITVGSKKKVWWQCEKGHEWRAAVYNRTSSNTGCPYCSNQKVLSGENDLATLVPELTKEWHPTKNGYLKPSEVLKGSEKKIWWQCEKGHEWQASVYSRAVNKTGCPYCSNNNVLSGYNDLASINPKVSEEWHPTKNGAILPNKVLPGSTKKVWWQCEKGHEWQASIYSRTKHGIGCPICSGREIQVGFNDLATLDPSLASEWSGVKNGPLTPQSVTLKSTQNVWWQCEKGHEWQASVYSRAVKKTGCPYCINQKVLPGINDLETKDLDLAKEWHPTKNVPLLPTQITAGSKKKVWWQCEKGHEWQASVYSRAVKKNGCPYCANKRVLIGYNDLVSTSPELAKEWHPTKNAPLLPTQVSKGSEKKVWWQCATGHEWQATIVYRATNKTTCPDCARGNVITGYNDLVTTNPELVREWHPTKNAPQKPNDFPTKSAKKVWWQCEKGHEWQATIVYRTTSKTGCPYCSSKNVVQGYNDLASTNPELAKEWHPTKNAPLLPTQVSKGSEKKVWWQCEKGHEWQTVVYSRTTGKSGCPYCSNQRAWPGYNDLASTNASLAIEWHPIKNSPLLPSQVTAGSKKRVWWQCEKGHEWQARICNRNVGKSPCPVCARKV